MTADIGAPGLLRAGLRGSPRAYGPVDVLVNNAALTWFSPVADFARGPVDAFVSPSMSTPRSCSAGWPWPTWRPGAAAPSSMSPAGSAVARAGGPTPTAPVLRGGVLYGTEKAALERFTQGLAEEVYPSGSRSPA